MAVSATFTGLGAYKLSHRVSVTDRVLGHGSYATVLELEYMGLKCAGKKIHELLLEQGGASYSVRRFEEECRLLSQVRHPNVVQFLGVHFQQEVPAPILVMEFLPTNLTSCIEQYGILPKEISYSILHDVALGLCYLHNQTPPIIHRDLSSNNVLLTPNMTAKISDLGVARILNLTPLQVSRMTQTPGTPVYMPPEVMIANPKYDTSVDEFSYGILMIHMFSGRWPEPQVGQTRFEDDKLIPVTEAERREVFLRAIGNDHPLMDLILKCIGNRPQTRAHASEIVERLAEVVLQFPASFANRLEMLRQIERLEGEKQVLRSETEAEIRRKEERIQRILIEEAKKNEDEIECLKMNHSLEIERLQTLVKDLNSKIKKKEERIQQMIENEQRNVIESDNLKMHHSVETKQLQLQVEDMKSKEQQLKAESEAEIEQLKSTAKLYEAQIDNHVKLLQQERYRFEIQSQKDRELYESQYGEEIKKCEVQLATEKEANKKLMSDTSNLRLEINSLQLEMSRLEADTLAKDNTILQNGVSMKRKDEEIEAKTKALEEKETRMSEMTDQLNKVREYLSTKQQVRRLKFI